MSVIERYRTNSVEYGPFEASVIVNGHVFILKVPASSRGTEDGVVISGSKAFFTPAHDAEAISLDFVNHCRDILASYLEHRAQRLQGMEFHDPVPVDETTTVVDERRDDGRASVQTALPTKP